MEDKAYYKIIRKNGLLGIACLQWFDEFDYKEEQFFAAKNGNPLKFDSEEEAQEWLNENIKPHLIIPEYRKPIEDTDYFK